MKQKKMMIIAAVVIGILVLGAGVFAYSKMSKKGSASPTPSEKPRKKRVNEPANVIPVAERPYVKISPQGTTDVILEIEELKKEATTVEYEIEYQSESGLKGFGGELELKSIPVRTPSQLLGSQSAGGAKTFHKGVQGGSLSLKFAGPQNYVLKQDWKYIENPKKETKFSMKDDAFEIDSKELGTNRLFIIYNSPGFPGKPSGEVISNGAYVLTSGTTMQGKATVTIQTTADAAGAKVMGWNGSEWKTFTGKAAGKSVTAEVDLMEAYIVTK